MRISGKNILLLVAPAKLIVVNLFLFGPFTIFKGNIDEFDVPFLTLLAYFLIPASIFILLFFVIGFLVSEKLKKRLSSILLTIGVLIWVQSNLLVWKYGLLDGQGIDWAQKAWQGWLDLFIWTGCLILAVLLYKNIYKLAVFLSIALISFQLFFLVVQSIQIPEVWGPQKRTNYPRPPAQGIFKFSTKQNVVLVIMDAFQSDIFQDIIQGEKRHYSSELEGFTFFRETTGSFPTTMMSIPAILSGKTYKNDRPTLRYITRLIKRKTINNVLHKSGFEVDLVCGKLYKGRKNPISNYYNLTSSYGVTKKKYDFSSSVLLLDLVLFRSSPHFLKRMIYNKQTWFLQSLMGQKVISRSFYPASKAFFNDMINDMKLGRSNPVYKLIHLMHPHPPIVINKNCEFSAKILPINRENLMRQAKCGLDQFVVFLNRLKSLGIYDSSLIILLADHGAGASVKMDKMNGYSQKSLDTSQVKFSKIVGSALPLMVIKKPFARGALTISDAPTMLTDIPATISSILHLNTKFDGLSMFDIKADAARKRIFFYYKWLHKNWQRDFFDSIQEFVISGSVYNVTSWSKGKTYFPPNIQKQLKK